MGRSGHKTGLWLEEFAAPYYIFADAGAQMVLATPAGGPVPIDPGSLQPNAQTAATRRYAADPAAQAALAATVPLRGVSEADFDALFYPGGHGLLWDLVECPTSVALIEGFERAGKPISFVCHGPAVLRHARAANGQPLVAGRRVTGFTNAEEAGAGLTNVVPFLIEDTFVALGAHYEKAADWASHVVVDGRLITGQNPASSEAVAEALLHQLAA